MVIQSGPLMTSGFKLWKVTFAHWPVTDRRGSRIIEVRKGRKTRKLKITVEMENIIRLQRELEEARSSLGQEVKDDAKDSDEETDLIRDDDECRRSLASKSREVERLKRKKPSWLRFGLKFGIRYGFELNLAYLCGFLAMDSKFRFGFEYGLPCWLIGYGLRLGFEIAYLCGLLAMDLKFGFGLSLWFAGYGFEYGFDIAYLCDLLAMVLESHLAEDAK
ncbi:hypothetical protein Taro_001959 [Colocasia esculenta]|uniref:Uncharacterized protein n=1 Tax=Colocasia esculenta TaxID=4460 RepID=A0A843TJE5_COLES|nr:hypothetical protein [Colocasia esculenta]